MTRPSLQHPHPLPLPRPSDKHRRFVTFQRLKDRSTFLTLKDAEESAAQLALPHTTASAAQSAGSQSRQAPVLARGDTNGASDGWFWLSDFFVKNFAGNEMLAQCSS